MQIRVASQDIEHGIAADCQRCPIARAFTSLGYDVTVDPRHVIFYGADGDTQDVPLPHIARHFLHEFDCGKPVAPVEFEIAVPDDPAFNTKLTKLIQ